MAACRSPAELELMRQALHTRITDAIASGEVTKDWSSEPTPATGYVEPVSSPSHGGSGAGWFQDKHPRNHKKKRRSNGESAGWSTKEELKASERSGRFRDDRSPKASKAAAVTTSAAALFASGDGGDEDFDPETLKIVGTCQTTEKSYFRLTSAPDPETVRPEPVLSLALSELKSKWRARFDDPPPRGGSGPVEYIWLCDQLKAVRQDLVVQHLKNEFTVGVYECHARVALEEGDMNEYNQCQTQLRELYGDPALAGFGQPAEFTAYRILYYLYLQGNKKYAEGSSDLLGILRELRAESKGATVVKGVRLAEKSSYRGLGLSSTVFESDAVQNALGLLRALSSANWVAFWRLADAAPNMGSYILDYMLPKCRLQALRTLLRAHKPAPLPLLFVVRMLHFDTDNEETEESGSGSRAVDEGCAECLLYLRAAGLVVVGNDATCRNGEQVDWSEVAVDTKASSGKPLDLEAIAAYEGTSGTLL